MGSYHDLTVRVACVLVTVTSLLRGPLIQRASFVDTRPFVQGGGDISVQIMPNITEDWAAVTLGRDNEQIAFRQGFANVTRDFQARAPVQVQGAQCNNCSMTIQVRTLCCTRLR